MKQEPRPTGSRSGTSSSTTNRRRAVAIGAGVALAMLGFAAITDYMGPPPADDVSAYRPALTDGDSMVQAVEANEGAIEGGDPHAAADPNALTSYNVPTEGPASPLFGAKSFEQRMLMFEEFGPQKYDESTPDSALEFPRPMTGAAPYYDPDDVASSGPSMDDLDDFIAEDGLHYLPSEYTNDIDNNPWQEDVEAFLGRTLDAPPAEGRPPGMGWAHQRWNEFQPQVYVKTYQGGARPNHGVRDGLQRHGYAVGEFGPGGLYHTVYDTDFDNTVLEGTTDGIEMRFHPLMPIQDHNSVWTWDGTAPPKLLQARYGEAVLLRHYNALPIDPAANHGFGLHTITTHEHNGHNPAESDGFANAFFFPGQYYDYRWPMQAAGYDTVNTSATDARMAYPCSPGETLWVNDSADGSLKTCDANGRIQLRGDWREMMGTHWFHDHMLDFTAQNVYKGNAAMMNYYSARDRGNEGHADGVNLQLPSGTALPWGNRDYDINLVVQDKAWDADGQLWFNIFNIDGFLGDRVLTNLLYHPYFEVRARKYRFRILNGSVSRYFKLALVKEVQGETGEYPGPDGSGVSYDRVGFHMIANDGNLLEYALPFDGSIDLDGDGNLDEHVGTLPTQAIAERYDIIVDFAQAGIEPGDKLYFVNLLEHDTGKGPKGAIPLEDVLSEKYLPVVDGDQWKDGDPAVGKFLQLRVMEYSGTDMSLNPVDYEPGNTENRMLTELPFDRNDTARYENAHHRTFEFGRSSGTDSTPWTVKTDGGEGLTADPRRISAAPQLAMGPTQNGYDGTGGTGYDTIGQLEVWTLENNSGGWDHPVHIHFEEGYVLARDGQTPPMWEYYGRKDVYRIGPDEDGSATIDIALRFREFAGTFVEHCHNTQHEDHAMLVRWDLEHPGQLTMMPAPIPTWDGVEYVDSHALPTYHSDSVAPPPPPPITVDVAFQIPGVTTVGGLTLSGTTNVTVRPTAKVNGKIASADLGKVRDHATAGDVIANGKIILEAAAVTGSLTTAGTSVVKDATAVSGVITKSANLGTPQTITMKFIEPQTVGAAQTVLNKATLVLAPGRYQSLTVNFGGTVQLSAGTYIFDDFVLNRNGVLKYDDSAGPVVIVVKNTFDGLGAYTQSPAAATSKLLIAYLGVSEVKLISPYRGFVVAPNASVKPAGTLTTHTGAFFGNEVVVTDGVTVNAAAFDPTVYSAPL